MAAQDLSQVYDQAGQAFNVDPTLLRSVAHVESGESNIDPRTGGLITSPTGAQGVMQFEPGTARAYGVNPADPVSSIYGAAHYIRDLLDQTNGNVPAALSIYNGASHNPPAAARYVNSVSSAFNRFNPIGTAEAAEPPPQAKAAEPTVEASVAQLSPYEQQLLTGKTPAAGTAAAEPAPEPPPDTSGLSPYEQQLLTLPKPAAPAAPATPAPDPNQNLPAWTPSRALTGQPSAPVFTPEQTAAGAGFVHGARQAVNPLLETASGVGNWAANKLSMPWLQTDRAAADAASEEAFQQQYGQNPIAQGAAAGARFTLPLLIGGGAGAATRLGLEAASMPELASFLSGTGGVGRAGILGWGQRLASGAATGAYQGLLAGGAPGALTGTLLGGAALPAVGGVADWVSARFGNVARAALSKVAQAMARDGMTVPQVTAALGQLGSLGTLADVEGPNIQQLAEGVANAPGPGQAAAQQYLRNRGTGQTARLNDAVRLATGTQPGQSAFDTAEQLVADRSAAAGPAYDHAFQNTVVSPAQARQLEGFIDTPVGQAALRDGVANIQLEEGIAKGTRVNLADYGVQQNPDGTYGLTEGTPNLRLYDAVKRGYDRLVENFRDPTSGRLNLSGSVAVPGMGGNVSGKAINDVRSAYTQTLRGMFPDYAKALDAWAGPSAAKDAIGMGRRVLSTDPDVTAANVARLSPSEKQMYNVGVAQALKDRINSVSDEADASRRIFGNQLLREKIAAGFGGANTPEFQAFRRTMENEAQFARTARMAREGSPTARRLAAIQLAQSTHPAAEAALALMTHGVSHLAAQTGLGAARALLARAGAPSERVSAELGNMLFNPAARQGALNQLSAGVGPSVRDALMGWRGQQAAQALWNWRQRLGLDSQQEPVPP